MFSSLLFHLRHISMLQTTACTVAHCQPVTQRVTTKPWLRKKKKKKKQIFNFTKWNSNTIVKNQKNQNMVENNMWWLMCRKMSFKNSINTHRPIFHNFFKKTFFLCDFYNGKKTNWNNREMSCFIYIVWDSVIWPLPAFQMICGCTCCTKNSSCETNTTAPVYAFSATMSASMVW